MFGLGAWGFWVGVSTAWSDDNWTLDIGPTLSRLEPISVRPLADSFAPPFYTDNSIHRCRNHTFPLFAHIRWIVLYPALLSMPSRGNHPRLPTSRYFMSS